MRAGATTAGFSLCELLAVLAVTAILLTMGVPGLVKLVHSQRMKSTVSDFLVAISLARAEALHQGRRIDLVPADGVDWASGWIVFADDNGNQRADAGERIIFSHSPAAGGMSIKAAFTDSKKQYLAYNGSGRTRTNASSEVPQLGTISFFLDGKIRRIKLNYLGRARICDPENDVTCTGAGDTDPS